MLTEVRTVRTPRRGYSGNRILSLMLTLESLGTYLDFEGQMEFANVALGLGILGGEHRLSIEAGE